MTKKTEVKKQKKGEVKELVLKYDTLEALVEKQKKCAKSMLNGKNAKLVGVVFEFMVDDEIIHTIAMRSYDPENCEDQVNIKLRPFDEKELKNNAN